MVNEIILWRNYEGLSFCICHQYHVIGFMTIKFTPNQRCSSAVWFSSLHTNILGNILYRKWSSYPPHTLTYPLPNPNNPLKLLPYIFCQTSVTMDFHYVILQKILIILVLNMLLLQFLLWLSRICNFYTELLQEK